ncbi:nuclear transport factor 2 family protein [Amycolatopsis taiwanensis]|uniref:nuclear transport factor 2 family protein n=1 Tax=Amycolatopsis taiwanensis TaxID=342230 RepID=UPI0004AE0E0A|nr:nuclear transport factor 2 family protein [Amycolatopsis taiwanensis]
MATSPREVFERLSQGIAEGRLTELADLYAEDTVVEHPQRPPAGSHIVGRKAVADHFAAMGGKVTMRARDVVIHETTDPEVIVAEYTYDGMSGRPFTSANVQLLRVRDGLIVHSRDYHDYLRMAAAGGGLDGLAKAYADFAPELPAEVTRLEPRTAIERVMLGVTSGANPADEYAENAYVTHPFHPSAPPLRGREDLRAHFAEGRGTGLRPHNVVSYATTDPEVVITEFAYVGTTRAGRPLVTQNIFITRIRDRLIVESRDYGDHLAVAAATGTLPDLFAAARATVAA